jgi:predicted ATPase
VELAELIKALFESYGAAALPWSVMAFLGWLVIRDRLRGRETIPHEYQMIIDRYNEALVDVTRSVERLAILIEERTRRQSKP